MELADSARFATLPERLKRSGKIKPDGRFNTNDMPTEAKRKALTTHQAMRDLARGASERIGRRGGR